MTQKWVITDPATGTSESFVANPSRGGSPHRRKNLRTVNTLAPGGNVMLFEGPESIWSASFAGVVLSAAQYSQLRRWAEATNPLTLTDDLGRTFTIVITEFLPEREYSSTLSIRHSYTVNYHVIGGSDRFPVAGSTSAYPATTLYPATDLYPAST